MSAIAWAVLFGLGLVWGMTFFFGEILLRSMTPFPIVFFRVSIAAALMVAIVYARGQRMPGDMQSWRRFMVMGFFNNAVPFSCIVFGQQYITGGLASILNAATAFFGVILAGIVFADERITAARLAGTAIGIAGVAVTIGPEHLLDLSWASIGQFLILAASMSYAIASVLGRWQMNTRRHGLEISAAGMLVASSFWMLVLCIIVGGGMPVLATDGVSILAILGYAIPCTALAYLMYFWLLKNAGAGNTMLVTLLIPPVAVVLDTVALGEIVGIREAAGFAIIALGLLVLSGKIRLPRRKT